MSALSNLTKEHPRYISAQGFTIVELLVVIVVIGILAAITTVSFAGIGQKAKVASLQSDLSNASTKLKLHYAEFGAYPQTLRCDIANSSANLCLKISSENDIDSYTSTASTFSIVASSSDEIIYNVNQDSAPAKGAPVVAWNWAENTSIWYDGTPRPMTPVNDPTSSGKGTALLIDFDPRFPGWRFYMNYYGGTYRFENGASYTTVMDVYGTGGSNPGGRLLADANLDIGSYSNLYNLANSNEQYFAADGTWKKLTYNLTSFAGPTGDYYLLFDEWIAETNWYVGNVTITKI